MLSSDEIDTLSEHELRAGNYLGRGGAVLSLRERLLEAVDTGDLEALEAIVSDEPRSLRYLVGLMYRQNRETRRIGARGIALASRYHPKMVKKIVQRLIWAMTDESCTYIPAAPEVLLAIAEEKPELLAPVAPDLIRLSADTSLNQGLCDTLRRIAKHCPGTIGQGMTKTLNERFRQGGRSGRRGNG